MERDQATRLMQGLLKKMVAKNGSDLFITAGFPPAIKVDGEIHRRSRGIADAGSKCGNRPCHYE